MNTCRPCGSVDAIPRIYCRDNAPTPRQCLHRTQNLSIQRVQGNIRTWTTTACVFYYNHREREREIESGIAIAMPCLALLQLTIALALCDSWPFTNNVLMSHVRSSGRVCTCFVPSQQQDREAESHATSYVH